LVLALLAGSLFGSLVVGPAFIAIYEWCSSNFQTNVERVHHYQRGRTSITGIGL
jgi:hypothetical protein